MSAIPTVSMRHDPALMLDRFGSDIRMSTQYEPVLLLDGNAYYLNDEHAV